MDNAYVNLDSWSTHPVHHPWFCQVTQIFSSLEHGILAVAGSTSVLGERVRRLRQDRRWTQAELAEKLGVHQKQISGYERGVHSPSVDVLIKMAEAFAVTLDYLAFEARGQEAPIKIQDRELLDRFEAIDRLAPEDKKLAKEILDLLILKNDFRKLVGAKPDIAAAG